MVTIVPLAHLSDMDFLVEIRIPLLNGAQVWRARIASHGARLILAPFARLSAESGVEYPLT